MQKCMVEMIFVQNFWKLDSEHFSRSKKGLQKLIIKDCNRTRNMPVLNGRLVYYTDIINCRYVVCPLRFLMLGCNLYFLRKLRCKFCHAEMTSFAISREFGGLSGRIFLSMISLGCWIFMSGFGGHHVRFGLKQTQAWQVVLVCKVTMWWKFVMLEG